MLLVTLAIPLFGAAAQAAPAPSAGSGVQQWAYGADKWVNASITTTNATATIHAFLGWHVIFTATNTSTSTFELEAQRTIGASYFADLCVPNCSAPKMHMNLTVTGWETDAGFANFTTNGTVYENGTAVQALAFENASSQSAGNLSEAMSFSGMMHNMTLSASQAFTLAGHSNAAIRFTPALGLVPWNVQANDTWNASSAFSAQGAWGASWSAQRTGFTGVTVRSSGHAGAQVNASGNVSVYGEDLGLITLDNGQTVPEIVLAVYGPFDDADGVILIPHDFDLFGSAHHEWDGSALAGQGVATAKLDLAIDRFHHRAQFTAAASTYVSGSTSLALTAAPSGGATPAATAAPTEVQAQPETVPQAKSGSACLVNACPTASTGRTFGSLIPLVAIALVALAVVGTISVVEWRVWSKRRAERGLLGSYGQVPTSGLPPAGAVLTKPSEVRVPYTPPPKTPQEPGEPPQS